jgi:hypothetical protein
MAPTETPPRFRVRSGVLWAIALVTLLLGFIDLARGGMTLAPILLVIGYCVLVPLAILK